MKWFLYFIAITALVSGFIFCMKPISGLPIQKNNESLMEDMEVEQISVDYRLEHLRKKADSAIKYCKIKGFSEEYCFLVNFNIHSGKRRFFIWDFKNDTILYASLCAHGCGKGSTHETPVYSNEEGSYCSSLGCYKVGVSSYSQWGIHIHYKLHGLDKTNSNAFKRIVVLHSYQLVPEYEIYPEHLPLGYSLGCPVISDAIMRKSDVILKGSTKPLLLWIYDESFGG